MKDVLIGIDQSVERAVTQAETILDLFEPAQVQAHLFHSFLDNPAGASITRVQSVKRAKEILEDADFDVQLHEASGKPVPTMLETAVEVDADLICVAGRNRSPTGKALFGSTSQSIILGTDRPVVVCGVEQYG
jgi:nucleotide-binding universal stress UspA family protein